MYFSLGEKAFCSPPNALSTLSAQYLEEGSRPIFKAPFGGVRGLPPREQSKKVPASSSILAALVGRGVLVTGCTAGQPAGGAQTVFTTYPEPPHLGLFTLS